MNKFDFLWTKEFERGYKVYKKDRKTLVKIDSTISSLLDEPFNQGLKTHLVNIPIIGKCWSSRVTRDIRILWTFSKENTMIIIGLRIGGHDNVYS
jgi:mRNA-degrading endonuclease YafQ of YafQ-DinJ toxin-antitoxin module